MNYHIELQNYALKINEEKKKKRISDRAEKKIIKFPTAKEKKIQHTFVV